MTLNLGGDLEVPPSQSSPLPITLKLFKSMHYITVSSHKSTHAIPFIKFVKHRYMFMDHMYYIPPRRVNVRIVWRVLK